ncbi:aromatic peroxygenase precursor [Macrolepiota fuliginosa MF-IS2]|uniref:Aromatic peroxygenase n=1 Tax=Macrolepiota fuliginosa MF-IS2 TaxID=1400762 RepID=A0A9P5X804_9AGAR|nr:aromatic peroxygenase precursor [Macrolepiota fuliginosa MF-IS2]
MVSFISFVSLALALASTASAFPAYGTLAGLPREELARAVTNLEYVKAPPPPGPLAYNGTKLVYDKAHPFKAPGPNDIRGPCPGLNTLANHGYLPRNGIVTPGQVITACMEGYNMENWFARFATYAGHLVDGNLITNLMSLGGPTPKTGPAPPAPALAGGLDTHVVFEGDASMTRADAYWGDNHSFNQTLYDELASFMDKYGGGRYNWTVANEFRWQRIQDSMATNPEFSLMQPRYFTVYLETTFPILFFVDGRTTENRTLSKEDALSFFKTNKFPEDWYRTGVPSSFDGIFDVAAAHPIKPGKNVNGVNTYEVDPTQPDLSQFCGIYADFVNRIVTGLYPNPTGELLEALNINLQYLYDSISDNFCPDQQQFPYGKPQ